MEAVRNCRIGGFIETTLLDWDGKIASEIFFQGCNFRCPFCHNSSLVAPPEFAETISWDKIVEYLKKQQGWIDGVILSGGEPTLCPEIIDIAGEIKSLGMKVKLDTNGSNPEIIENMTSAGLLDAVSMDIKTGLTEKQYNAATGVRVDLKAVGRSVKFLMDSGIDSEFRTTVCPGVVTEDDVVTNGLFLYGAGVQKGRFKYVLQNFQPGNCLNRDYNAVTPHKKDELQKIARAVDAATNGAFKCVVRGDS